MRRFIADQVDECVDGEYVLAEDLAHAIAALKIAESVIRTLADDIMELSETGDYHPSVQEALKIIRRAQEET